jgi:hypothetical protein
MALEAFKGKTVPSRGFGGGGYILSGWEALTQKNRGSCGVWEIFRDFCGFLKRLEWFRT